MKWFELLIKKSVDDFLFDPEPSDTAEDRVHLAELRRLCGRELTSMRSYQQLKAELKDFTAAHDISERVREVLGEVREQLSEILEDLRFARSARGRFVAFCNDYVQDLYKTVRARPEFADAFVGAHNDREALVVAGHVPNEAALDGLRAIISAHPPGVEVVWRVTYGQPH